jgi:phosphoenolpyruvate carboxykinase (ATP)
MRKHNVRAYLVNTGWAGGPHGVGQRMKIKLTRSIIDGIFDGSLEHDKYTKDTVLNLEIPDTLGDYDKGTLHPRESWADKDAYDAQRRKLAEMFIENFKQYADIGKEFDFTSHGPQLG